MNKIKGAIVMNIDRYKGCLLCVVACPQKVIELTQKQVNMHGYRYTQAVNPDDCVGCAACGIICSDECITVYRKRVEV